jgi:hypothetical protein
MILGLLSKRKATEKLDPNGLARVLKDETQTFLDQGGEPVSVIRSALDAGDKAAEYKSQFTPQEWTLLRLAPLAAARLVMQASPSGAVGSMKEAGAAGQSIAVTRASSDPTSLISLAYDTDLTKEEAAGLGDRATNLKVIKEALVVLAHRSPSDVPAYAQFIHTVALKVAEETREGGFLGIGGTRISREEQAVLDEIDTLTGALA